MRLSKPLLAAGSVLLLATCDAITAPEPKRVAVRYAADSVLVVGASSTPAVEVRVNDELVAGPRVYLESLDTAVLAVTDGVLVARRRGLAQLRIALAGSMLPPGTPPTLQTIAVTVGGVALGGAEVDTLESVGESRTLVPVATDVRGDTIRDDVGFAFTSSDSLVVAVDAAGQLTARGAGSATVAAAADGHADSVRVHVVQRLDRLGFRPEVVTLDALRAVAVVVAEGRDALGGAIAFAPGTPTDWTSEDTLVATVDGAGTVTAVANGTTYLNAVRSGIGGRVRVDVRQRAARIDVTPVVPPALEAPGDTLRLAATLRDRLGSPMSGVPAWASADPTLAAVDAAGTVTSRAEGAEPRPGRVVVAADSAADTVAVTVLNRPVAVVLADRRARSLALGDSVLMAATVRNRRDAPVPGVALAWRTGDAAVARASAGGWITALAVGSTVAVASAGGYPLLADSAGITVVRPAASLAFAESALRLAAVGAVTTPAIVVRDADGNALDRSVAHWSSSNAAVASVTADGVVTATGEGTALVVARSGTVADTLPVTVSNAPARLELNAVADYFSARGQSRTYTALVTNALGAPIAGYPVRWASTNANVATVDGGKVMTVGSGVAFVTASAGTGAGTVADTVRITVDDAVRRIVVVPKTATIASAGDTLALAAVALNAVNEEVGTFSYGWRAATAADSLVVAVLADGRVVGRRAGTARVVASLDVFADTAALVVNNPVAAIDLPAALDTLRFVGATVTPPVAILNANALPIDDRRAVAWVTGSSAVATVTAEGVVTARGEGRTWLYATAPGAADSVPLVVAQSAVALRVSAPTTTLVVRERAAFTVTALDAVGRTVPAASVVWRTSNPAVAAVTEEGVVQAAGVGSAWVVAATPQLADSVLVSVRRLTLLQVHGDSTGVSVGTAREPFARIQDAVAAALPGDTVLVRRASAPYAEALSITRALTLLGDQAGYAGLATTLPEIVHRSGPAAITVTGGDSVAVRYFSVRHEVDGPAVDVQGAPVWITDLHVNPGATARVGGGVSVANARAATLERLAVAAVRTAGVRLADVTAGLVRDATVKGADGACVLASGAGAATLVSGGAFSECGAGAVSLSGRVARVYGVRAVASGAAAVAVEANGTDSASVSASTVVDHPLSKGVLLAGGAIRADSNRLARNLAGLTLTRWSVVQSVLHNDVMDNVSAGVQNASGTPLMIGATWWGDGRGVRRTAFRPYAGSAGDTIAGVVTSTARTTPLVPGAGGSAVRLMRGDGQTVKKDSDLPVPITVRVVDAEGRPAAGVAVTFAVTAGAGRVKAFNASGGSTTYVVSTDASGLAEAGWRLGTTEGVNLVRASVGALAVNFTATGTR